jgi:hypothetical protein
MAEQQSGRLLRPLTSLDQEVGVRIPTERNLEPDRLAAGSGSRALLFPQSGDRVPTVNLTPLRGLHVSS